MNERTNEVEKAENGKNHLFCVICYANKQTKFMIDLFLCDFAQTNRRL